MDLDVFIRTYGYSALFGVMVIEQFVPPMPGEPVLLGAGALAGTGHLRLWFAAALALAGTVVGDLVWYEIGRRGGHLRADAYETIACSWLSLTTLIGLLLNAVFGWWWADPLAALAIIPLVVREGLEGLRGECHDSN